MPEFFPDHVPTDVDEFTAGYLGAAEWLLPEPQPDDQCKQTPRDKIRGWTRKSIAKAKRDCASFQAEHAADLAEFCEATGRGMDLAGYCFWLNRNGHGAGFWDRDAGACGDILSVASRRCGECGVDAYRGWIHLS